MRNILPYLRKERCKRYYENNKQKKISAEAAAPNLLLNGGASTSTGSFTMSSENEFEHVSIVCDRLWFLKDVTPKSKNEKFPSVLGVDFPDKDVQAFNLRGLCKRSLCNSKIPPFQELMGSSIRIVLICRR
ncbi:hypothetical protein AVEN_75823-1 [Araneus ventricosus]|uniref:Uncharacterized protein n=1 Tax=Araneus ventricosus TaxID=182803 RepID=A0A4Y2KDC8_ARAVE|nr:hypothetical protein AVEN_75823-1 [Araneus ventricosus]